jgi:hypothetical protein
MFLKTKPQQRVENSLRFRTRKRYPSKFQWQMLKKLQLNTMEPQTFVERWEVTHEQLAVICSCSIPTVGRWFMATKNKRNPSLHHKFLLGLANKLWTDLLLREED